MKKIALLISAVIVAGTVSETQPEWLPTMMGRAGKNPLRWCVKRNISNRNDIVMINGKKLNAFNMMASGISDQGILKAFNQPACPANTSIDFWITRNEKDPMRAACCMDCPSKTAGMPHCPNHSAPIRNPLDKHVFCCPTLE